MAFDRPILGWAEQISGNLNGAEEWIGRVLQSALEHPHLYSRAFGLMQIAAFYLLGNQPSYARRVAEQSITLSSEKSFLQTRDLAAFYHVCAECAQGPMNDASAPLGEAIALIDRAWGADLLMTMILGLHAQACLRVGLLAMASSSIRRAFEIAERSGESMFLSELHRLQGEIFRGEGELGLIKAKTSFREAIRLSREQGAKLFELRATVRLARLLVSERKQDEAREALSNIYSSFTEGFHHPDLKDARALLDELDTT